MNRCLKKLVCCGVVLNVLPCYADVKMPAIFGDHMVLQQEGKIPVWGRADPGEQVAVILGNRSGKAVADGEGKWRINLEALQTSASPMTLTVTGKNSLKFEDVLVGDVWLCSGQSNMAFQLWRSDQGNDDASKATDGLIRFFVVGRVSRVEPQADVSGKWEVCTPQSAARFSAVGYYFADELKKGGISRPLGLIGSYWGGTPAQTWMSLSGLKNDPPFTNYVQQYDSDWGSYVKNKEDYPRLVTDYEDQKRRWEAEVKPSYDPIVNAWRDEANRAKAEGRPVPPKPQPARPEPVAPPGYLRPCALFNGMIAPLIPYAMKGVIWYQGESNAGQSVEYARLFPRLIVDWREKWGRGDFPFLFVQLAGYGGDIVNPIPNRNWPLVRDAQLKALSVANTGMAVTLDIGNAKDIHPTDKRDVGVRLALAARHVAYGQDLVYSGPVYKTMKADGNKLRIAFQKTDGGLVIGVPPCASDGKGAPAPKELKGFAIAGTDRSWHWAQAAIEGDAVVVSCDQVPEPVAVRYGWADVPTANLYNKEGLPTSPFRTDDWDDSFLSETQP